MLRFGNEANLAKATELGGGYCLGHALIAHVTVRAQMQFRLRLPLRSFRDALSQRGFVDFLLVPEKLALRIDRQIDRNARQTSSFRVLQGEEG